MKARPIYAVLLTLVLLITLAIGTVQASTYFESLVYAPQAPLGYAFTYQGYLADGASAANGIYDFQFRLYDALSAGSQVGSQVAVDNLNISHGYFTAALDFGSSPYTGQKLWLEIDVRPDGSGSYSTLAPRVELTATPYAVFAKNSDALDGHDTAYFQRDITQ